MGKRDPRAREIPAGVCKLSGLVTEADWTQWTPDDIRPYLDVAFDCFGADRLLVGSDWPVCTLAADYARTIALIDDYMAEDGRGARRRDGWQCGALVATDALDKPRRPERDQGRRRARMK